MQKVINDLIIKTQILETMYEKSDHREKKRDLSKNRDKIFLIRNHARRCGGMGCVSERTDGG